MILTRANAADNHFCVRIFGPVILMRSRMNAGTDTTATLVARFRRQRPLRGGSLIITVFGDALAPRGGAVTLGSLISLMAPFGLTERLVRTSVARLAADDWLAGRRVGRLSEYRLSPAGRQRFMEATRRIYAGPATEWSGRWTLVLMPGATAALRRQIRETLRWEGFGELEPGLLAHPTLTLAETREHLAGAGLAEQPILLESRSAGAGADQRLVREGWDLRELAGRYGRFMRHFEPVLPLVREPLAPADAFLVRTLLIHEYRKIHLRDPLLPPSLLPADWPGSAAYEVCRTIYERVFPAAEQHLSDVAARLDGRLPVPEAAVYRRFAGLPRV
jgi:phenylacetic acid degradation operon negative regulatory protein